ncbi:hypothetical protein ANO11243_019670 [Dothideomycetidae sp. 11243]|nr:hypothetical protein ANO11243_019670 [fungal sp. No.11243]
MPAKRKRPDAVTPSTKRIKSGDHWDLDDPEVYEVEAILDENKTQYLISWAPNIVTGEEYSPGWYPKSFVNRPAVQDWERKKKLKRVASLSPIHKRRRGRPKKDHGSRSGLPTSQRKSLAHQSNSPSVSKPTRPAARRIIDSSPLPESHDQTTFKEHSSPSISEQASLPPQSQHTVHYLEPIDHQVRIEISPLRSSQRAQYASGSYLDFRTSQLLTGSAPEQRSGLELSHSPSTQSRYIDAAAAPDLSQRHSQYQEDYVSSSPSGLNTDATTSVPQSGPSVVFAGRDRSLVVPDSQSGNSSLLLVPQSESESRITNGESTQSNIVVNATPNPREASDNSEQKATTLSGRDNTSEQSRDRAAPSVIFVSSGTDEISQSQLDSSPGALAITRETRGRAPSHALGIKGLAASESSSLSFSPEKVTSALSEGYLPASLPAPFRPIKQLLSGLASGLRSPFKVANKDSSEEATQHQRSRDTSSGTRFETQISPPTYRASAFTGKIQNRTTDLFSVLNGARENQAIRTNQVVDRDLTLDTSTNTLRRPPSQWPDTFRSAPPRPDSVPDSLTTPPGKKIMSSASPQSAESETSLRIQELRDAGGPITPAQRSLGMTTRSLANRAGSPSVLREARSPSVVPSAEVVPMPSAEENRTSERYLTLVPEKMQDATGKKPAPSGITDESSVDGQSDLEELNKIAEPVVTDRVSQAEGPLEFTVPLFFSSHQRDMYKQSIVWRKKFVEEFLSQYWPEDSPLVLQAQQLVQKLRNVTSHPDLMNEESFTQDSGDPKNKAQWDKDCSTKFRFIAFLLSDLAQQNLHIVIDVQSGRLLEILDHFLTGLDVPHITAGAKEDLASIDTLRVTLLPKQMSATDIPKADLVIGFEGSADLIEDQRKELRTAQDNTIAPLFYLVVPKTVEHVERYLREDRYSSLSLVKKLVLLVENAARLRAEAGYRQIHDQDTKNAAASVAKFVVDGCKLAEWPLDSLPGLHMIDSSSDSQATTVSESSNAPALRGAKRTWDDENNDENGPKKVRIENIASSAMPSTINPASMSLSAITDSVDRQIVAYSEYESDMASLKHEHEVREAVLRKQVSDLEVRLEEHVSALEDLQYRHEEQRAELVKIQTERDTAQQKATVAITQMSSRDTLVNKIKAERDEYKALLAESKAALASHDVPEIADFEALKSKTADAEKEKAKLESKVKSLTTDLEYIRGLYQELSTKGARVIEEKNELESRVVDLEKKASDSVANALRLANDSTHQQLRVEIKRLKLTLADREKVLRQREEEMTKLREKERGRMGTRGASVPRSPGRLGSPMRLEPPRSSAVGSRAASPRRGSPATGAIGVAGAGKSRLGR